MKKSIELSVFIRVYPRLELFFSRLLGRRYAGHLAGAVALAIAIACAAQAPVANRNDAAQAQQAKKENQAKKAASKAAAMPASEGEEPFIAYVFPPGARQGSTIEAVASGTNLVSLENLAAANSVRVSGGGVSTRILEAKDSNQVRFSVTVSADAQLGERELRLVSPSGVSNRFRFFIGRIPEVRESEPNSTIEQAQRLPALPVVVNGQILEGDRDYFRFAARRGEKLVLEVAAQRIVPFLADGVPGWFDACLSLYDARGKELAYVDDYRLKPDPVMFFDVPADGEYIAEVRDVIFRGRGDFVYRLTIGALPYITSVFPLGAQRGTSAEVSLEGVNLPVRKLTLEAPAAPALVRRVSVEGAVAGSNEFLFAAGDAPELFETEPNDQQARAQRIPSLPATLNGRIDKPGDVDWYSFRATAGQRLSIEVRARRLDSPLDSILTLVNASGAVLAENDDWVDPSQTAATHHADSRILFTFSSAGEYFVKLRDVQGKGGPEYAYRLTIAPPRPDFELRITPDTLRVGQGDTVAVTVKAIRKDGFDGEIRLTPEHLPEGFAASGAVIPAGQSEGRLTVTAPPDAPLGVISPGVTGSAQIGGAEVRRTAEPAEAMMQAFAYTHYLATGNLSLCVLKPSAFTLASSVDRSKPLELGPASEFPIPVKVVRRGDFKGGISLTALKGAPALTVRPVFVAADKDEGTLVVVVAGNAPVGLTDTLVITGAMKTGKGAITRALPAITVKVVAAGQPPARAATPTP